MSETVELLRRQSGADDVKNQKQVLPLEGTYSIDRAVDDVVPSNLEQLYSLSGTVEMRT